MEVGKERLIPWVEEEMNIPNLIEMVILKKNTKQMNGMEVRMTIPNIVE